MDRILLVEDEPLLRDVLARFLRAAGYHVNLAATAPEALDSVEEQLPALIVIDNCPPVMDGYALIRRLRSRNGRHIFRCWR
jgi:CheY-like chemotaxis protein